MRQYRPSVWLFLLHSAIYCIGLFGIPDVLTNFYLVSVGYTPDEIGVLLSVSRVAGLLTGIPVGYYGTRLGEKRLIVLGTVGAAATLVLMVFFPSFAMIALSRFMLGVFYGAWQIISTPFMVHLVPLSETTRFFSLHNVVTMVATSGGTLLGGYLPALLVGAQPGTRAAESTEAYALGMIASGVIVLLSVIPLHYVQSPPAAAPPLAGGRSAPRLLRTPWRLLFWLAAPMVLFGFTGGLTFPFYNLYFRDTFAISDDVVGLALSIGWLGMAIIPIVNPWVEARFGRAGAIALLMSAAALSFFGLAHAPTLAVSVAFFTLAASLRNCLNPLFQPLLMSVLPESQHNLASSVSTILWNMGWFTANVISGVWQTQQGFSFIFTVVSIGVFINGWAVLAIFRGRQAQLQPQPVGD